MKKKLSPIVIASLITGCSNFTNTPDANRSMASVPGQVRPNWNGRYDGPPPDFNRGQWDRRPGVFNYCDKYRNDTGKHVLACNAGISEAMNMATRFAGAHGKEDGYLRGYAWGLNQAINYYQNNQDVMMSGEGQVDSLNNYFNAAVGEGQQAGSRDGDSLGSSEAKNRFYQAIDTKVMPSPAYQAPVANFNPTQDAYSRYIGAIPTADDILKRDRYGRMPFYDGYDRTYGGGGNWHERNGRDMYSRDGVYGTNSAQWVDGQDAFKIWLNIPSQGVQRYNSLNTIAYNEMEDSSGRYPAQARPGGDNRPGPGAGQPGQPGTNPQRPTPPQQPTPPQPQQPTPPTQPQQPTQPTQPQQPPQPVVDFQAIFRDAFVQAYNAFAPSEYSKNYYAFIDNGQRDGEANGTEIGVEIAQKKGLARAFNRKFAQISFQTYQSSFVGSYGNSFNNTYNYFKNNPVLTLNFMGIIGNEDDGVVQPAESFAVKFKVTNAGGVPSKLTYTVAGDVEDAKTFTDSVNAISTKVITSAEIGDVLSTLEDGASASYVLSVNDMKEKLWQDIKRPIEFNNVQANYSNLDGSGMYTITLANVATVAVNGTISLELRINGNSVKTVVGTPMQPGEKKTYALDFNALDPLVWINSGYNVEILLKYNNVMFGRKAFSLSVSDSVDALAQYYTRLINEKGVVPAGKTLDTRIAEVRNLLLQKNAAEVTSNIDSSGNVYRTAPETTIPGKISRAKDTFANNSSRAVGEFTSLADAMAPEAKRFKSTLFIHPKRDAYNDILGKIGGKKYK